MKDARLEAPLKDCPFCGGPAETDSQRAYRSIEGKLGKAVAVYCTGSCSADMTLCLVDVPGSTWEDLLAVLIENWNRRIPDPRIAEWEASCTGKHGSQMPCVGSVHETSDECPKCRGTGAQDRPYQLGCDHPGPFRDEHGYYEKLRLPETKAALDRVLVCLEHRKGEDYRVQVREGQSERFWTELADALVERRALKTGAEP